MWFQIIRLIADNYQIITTLPPDLLMLTGARTRDLKPDNDIILESEPLHPGGKNRVIRRAAAAPARGAVTVTP